MFPEKHGISTRSIDLTTWFVYAAGMVLLLAGPVSGAASERYHQQIWCARYLGQTEVVLADRTRVDCLTSTHAIEFDFGKKWAEAIGQSLGYAQLTGKQAGIVLIVLTPADLKYWRKLRQVIKSQQLQITTWCTGSENCSEAKP